MKRRARKANLFPVLRRRLLKTLGHRGAKAELARYCGTTRQAIDHYFVREDRMPRAELTLAAARWTEERQHKILVRFIPSAAELNDIMERLVPLHGVGQKRLGRQAADYCGISPGEMYRYFRSRGQRRRPDGETVLQILRWLRLLRSMPASRVSRDIYRRERINNAMSVIDRFVAERQEEEPTRAKQEGRKPKTFLF